MSASAVTSAPAPLWRTELAATVKLAWPLILTQIATIALNTIDLVMLGWLGPEQLAAATLGNSMVFPMTLFGIGLLAATAAMFSQELGAIRLRGVRRTLRQGMWAAITLCLPCMVFLWNAEDFLRAIGQDPRLAARSSDYTSVVLWGLIPLMCFTVLRNFVTAHSRPRSAMVTLILAILVNGIADYALIFGHFGAPALGLKGAALATVIVQIFMFLGQALFVVTDRQFRRYNLFGRFWRPDWHRYFEILKIGVPIGLTVLAEVGLFAASAMMIGLFGPDQLAAHAVAQQCAAFAFMIPLGICQAATIRVGLAIGRSRPGDALLAGHVATAVGVGFAIISALAFWLFPEALVAIFMHPDDPDAQRATAYAVSFLRIAAIFQLVDAGQAVASGSLRGIKDTTVPAVLAFFGYWVFGFPAGAYLGFYGGYEGQGVWAGLAVGLTLACVALLLRFEILMRRSLGKTGAA